MDNKITTFNIKDITFPKLDFQLGVKKQNYNFQQLFKFEIEIIDNTNITVNFGVGLIEPPSKPEDTTQCRVFVEAIGYFQYNSSLGELSSYKDTPMLPNILATLYPFIREKINYCFSNNKVQMLLPPLNVAMLINNIPDAFKMNDKRAKTESK